MVEEKYTRLRCIVRSLCILAVLALSGCAALRPGSSAEGYIPASRGGSLYYHVVGQGPDTLLVLHDGPALDMNTVAPELRRLARRHTLIFYDQRGGGQSVVGDTPQVERPSSWMSHPLYLLQHVRDIETVRKHFGLRRVSLVGFGWGAGLAAVYASDRPEHLERLVLVDPIPPSREPYFPQTEARRNERLGPAGVARLDSLREVWASAEDVRAVCREYFHTLYSADVADPAFARRMRGTPCTASSEVLRRYPRTSEQTLRFLQAWRWQPMLSRITVPTLVIRGEEDPVPLEAARDWARSIPDARLLVVPGAGAFPHVERPGEFFPAVEEFLRGGWPRGLRSEGLPRQT